MSKIGAAALSLSVHGAATAAAFGLVWRNLLHPLLGYAPVAFDAVVVAAHLIPAAAADAGL